MDPDACLAELRALLVTPTNQNNYDTVMTDIVERIEALDQWLSNGGFLPMAWAPQPSEY